ncbi:MFS transporter [Sphingomonas quercus]|uniref:Multidrug efflux pump Tap n=1 Tax=Sphingomonas quercus TaxID=2842451 RepID=A0ABS6BMK3_9SPHN|nr:MFS transporter [Sphingomonas quercus]MBU3079414.1 MFS transporter [Sphingomonas quercus]
MADAPHPLRIRDYRLYLLSRFSTTVGQLAMVIVIGWQVYDIARRTMPLKQAALQLGYVGLIQFAPLALLTLVVGWTADRVDRRWVARAAVTLEIVCAVMLAEMSWRGTTTLPALFIIAALLGVARAFAGPALSAIAPNLVPRAVLPTAIALSSIAWQSGSVIGPALGGYLYAIDRWVPYAVSTVLFTVSLTALMLLRPLPRREAARGNPWRQAIEGLAYVRRNKLVLGAISLDLFAVLLGGATAMLPVFARDVLHVGPEGLGDLRAAPAFGSAVTALWFAFRPLKHNVGRKMLGAVAVFGGGTVLFGLSRWMPLSLGCLALVGAADMFSVYVRQSLIQLHTPDEMRGRVGAVSSLFVSGSNELGEAESGLLGAVIGPVPAVIAGGFGAVIVVLLWTRLFPELRNARNFDPPENLDHAPTEEKLA